MSKFVSVDNIGASHLFESELDAFVQCDEWLEKNKSKEDFDHWVSQSSSDTAKTDKAISLYNDWVIANKITHTITYTDGKVTTTSYKDIA